VNGAGGGRHRTPGALVVAGVIAVLGSGCSAGSDPTGPAPQAQPPAPPAACLLDGSELAATTGVTWIPDQSAATDTRCVYDPAGDNGPAGFLAVDVSSSTDDAATQLDTIGEICESGSRSDVDAADGGFVCRFDGDGVYAALVQGGQVVTVATSAVPTGTTAARLAVAFTQQLTVIGKG